MPFYRLFTADAASLLPLFTLLLLLHISRSLFCYRHQTFYAPKSAQAYVTCIHICSPLSRWVSQSPNPPSLLPLSTPLCSLFRNHNALSSSDPNQTSLQLNTKCALQRGEGCWGRSCLGTKPQNRRAVNANAALDDAIVCAPRLAVVAGSIVASWSVKWGYARAAASAAAGASCLE